MNRHSALAITASLLVGLLSNTAWATDTDGDGLPDSLETALGTNPASANSDADAWGDFQEVFSEGTSPLLDDTDGDTLDDATDPAPLDNGNHAGSSAPTFTGAPSGILYAWSGASPTDGEGVYVHNGMLMQSFTVGATKGVGLDGGFRFVYNSKSNWDGTAGKARFWIGDTQLIEQVNSDVDILLEDGIWRRFTWNSGLGTFTSPIGCTCVLVKTAPTTFVRSWPAESGCAGGVQSITYSNGVLDVMQDRFGNAVTFNYTLGVLVSATDTRGLSTSFSYYGTGRLQNVTAPDGRAWTFSYNPQGQLMSVDGPPTTSFPSGIHWEYRYINGSSSASLNDNLVGVIDGRGNLCMSAEYDASDRLTKQTVGGGSYLFDYTNIASQHTVVTDRNGNLRDWYWHSTKLTKTQLVEQTNRGVRGGEPDYTTYWDTDIDGYLTDVTYPRGNGVRYALNAAKLPTEVRRKADMSVGDNNTNDLIDAFAYDSGKYYGMTKHADPLGDITTSGCYTAYTLNSYGQPTGITFPTITHSSTTVTNANSYNADGTLASHTDGEGNVTSYSYYSSGARKGRVQYIIVDPGGGNLNLTTQYDYTDWGDVKQVIDPNGNTRDYVVEAYGNVTEVDYPAALGYVTTFEHDGNLNVVARHVSNIDETGTPRSPATWNTTTTYTTSNKPWMLTQATSAVASRTTFFTYDANGNLTELQRGTMKVDYEYDERDRVYLQVRDPGGGGAANATSTFDYDGNRNLVAFENARGYTTAFDYDLFDRKTKMTTALGDYRTFDYDKCGNVTDAKVYDAAPTPDVLMAHHKRAYDEMERPWKDEDLLTSGPTWYTREKVLDGNGRVTTFTNRRGKDTGFVYDAGGRMVQMTDAIGNVIDYTPDDNGNVLVQVETEQVPGGGTEAFETDLAYDAINRRISQTVKDRNNGTNTKVTQWEFDSTSFLCKETDPMTYATTYTHDGLNRKLTKTEPLHSSTTATTSWLYDFNDHVLQLSDDNGTKTRYTYNNLGYLTQTVHDYVAPPGSPHATTRTTTFVPDANGNLYQWTDPNGTTVTQTFDDLDRVTARSASLGSGVAGDTNESFTYDALSRMTQAGDNDSTVDYAYDSLSRLLTEAQTYGGNTKTTTYASWSAENQLEQLNYASGFSAHRTYDDVDRLAAITDGTNAVASFNLYGAAGRWRTTTLGNTTHAEYTWDGFRRPTVIDHQDTGNSSFAGFEYDFDKNDNPLYEARTHKSGKGEVYSYDKLNRLSRVLTECDDPANETANPGAELYVDKIDFSMDGVHNILQQDTTPYGGSLATTSYAVDPLNQYTTAGAASPTYDNNGNLTDDGTHTYVYDFHNHLIEAKTGVTTIHEGKYDAVGRGRRIKRVANGSTTTRYVYAGQRAIEEYNGSNVLQRSFVFGDGIDQVVMEKAGASLYYFHAQLIGSVTHVTNAAQAVVESYEYGPYGETTIKNGGGTPISATAVGNRYGFTGRQFDEETGLYYFRARHYSPSLRRFLQSDPAGYIGSMNLKAYCADMPTCAVDPSGLRHKIVKEWTDPPESNTVSGETPHQKDGYCEKWWTWSMTYTWVNHHRQEFWQDDEEEDRMKEDMARDYDRQEAEARERAAQLSGTAYANENEAVAWASAATVHAALTAMPLTPEMDLIQFRFSTEGSAYGPLGDLVFGFAAYTTAYYQRQDAAAAMVEAALAHRSAEALRAQRGSEATQPAGPDVVTPELISLVDVSQLHRKCTYPLCGQAAAAGVPFGDPFEEVDDPVTHRFK